MASPVVVQSSYQSDEGSWAHGGLATGATGELITFDQGTGEIIVVNESTGPTATHTRIPTPARTGHGLATRVTDGDQGVWVVDPGIESRVVDGGLRSDSRSAWVGLVKPDGQVAMTLSRPRHRKFRGADFRPTALVELRGQRGTEIWLADGYGSGAIFRYDEVGDFIAPVDASRLDPPAFDTPHDLASDGEGVFVADRGNGRIVSIHPSGIAVGSFGEGLLSRPAGIACLVSEIAVADLDGRVSLFRMDGNLERHVTGHPLRRHGRYWPNDGRGGKVRAPRARSAVRSPHGICVRRDRTLWVSEWVIGGGLLSIPLDAIA